MTNSEQTSRSSNDWRAVIETVEMSDADAARLAASLFRKSFGHPIPAMPRHFAMLYQLTGTDGSGDRSLMVLGYIHHLPFEDVHLAGGLCIDPRGYRLFPRRLFAQVKQQGGLATILLRESIAQLDERPAVFAHVGEKRSRLALLRAAFVDTGRRHLMVHWRSSLQPAEQQSLVDRIDAVGAF